MSAEEKRTKVCALRRAECSRQVRRVSLRIVPPAPRPSHAPTFTPIRPLKHRPLPRHTPLICMSHAFRYTSRMPFATRGDAQKRSKCDLSEVARLKLREPRMRRHRLPRAALVNAQSPRGATDACLRYSAVAQLPVVENRAESACLRQQAPPPRVLLLPGRKVAPGLIEGCCRKREGRSAPVLHAWFMKIRVRGAIRFIAPFLSA